MTVEERGQGGLKRAVYNNEDERGGIKRAFWLAVSSGCSDVGQKLRLGKIVPAIFFSSASKSERHVD